MHGCVGKSVLWKTKTPNSAREFSCDFWERQFFVHPSSQFPDRVPRVVLVGVLAYLEPISVQISVQSAAEIFFELVSQIHRITWAVQKSRSTWDDVRAERSDIGSDGRESEAVSQKQHSALKDVFIRQYQNIGSFEI